MTLKVADFKNVEDDICAPCDNKWNTVEPRFSERQPSGKPRLSEKFLEH